MSWNTPWQGLLTQQRRLALELTHTQLCKLRFGHK
jgi:hypothetical protein